MKSNQGILLILLFTTIAVGLMLWAAIRYVRTCRNAVRDTIVYEETMEYDSISDSTNCSCVVPDPAPAQLAYAIPPPPTAWMPPTIFEVQPSTIFKVQPSTRRPGMV
ncbi:hypothetical protein BZA05DRAFT_446605 [Tricharina praecox]|uniref:uncharacterized protein n=1 Tax=Tricharina praecox TaxID=43433 RepID=UPI00221FD6DE|nr:uncharacterized protein BZA05DRAFT_446605 [Tricharina praecox]KAI5848312.1 hypothetical protein BZA05DRAFT_446605 [Tricharina praecox]